MTHADRIFCEKCNKPATERKVYSDYWCDKCCILTEDDIILYCIDSSNGEDFIVTDIIPLKSAAGWYAGRNYYDKEIGVWLPYDRVSDYMESYTAAKKWIDDTDGEMQADFYLIKELP